MNGPWIKMRIDLSIDPAVIAIAMACGIDEDAVVGKLHRLWGWAFSQTIDGNAPGVTFSWVDRYLGVTGFAAAMEKAGWLDASDASENQGIRIPRWDTHNSESAKSRAMGALRVATCRAKNGNAKANAKRNAPSVTKVLPKRDQEIEEEIEEEKKEIPLSKSLPFSGNDKERETEAGGRVLSASGDTLGEIRAGNPILPGDRPDLFPAAKRIVEHYQTTVRPGHRSLGGVEAVLACLAAGTPEDQLRTAADGYAHLCNTHGHDKRLAVFNFYSQEKPAYREFLLWTPPAPGTTVAPPVTTNGKPRQQTIREQLKRLNEGTL